MEPTWVNVALPVSTGVTLYVAASDLIPEVNALRSFKMAAAVFAGVALSLLGAQVLEMAGLH